MVRYFKLSYREWEGLPCLHTHSSTVLSQHVQKNFATSQNWLILPLWTLIKFAYMSHKNFFPFFSLLFFSFFFALEVAVVSVSLESTVSLTDDLHLLVEGCVVASNLSAVIMWFSFFLHVLMEPCATSQLLSTGKTCTGLLFMNGLECKRLAAGFLGVVATLSTVSWLRNAIDDSYFYMIACGRRRRSGIKGWAHGFTCSNSTSLMGMDGVHTCVLELRLHWGCCCWLSILQWC